MLCWWYLLGLVPWDRQVIGFFWLYEQFAVHPNFKFMMEVEEQSKLLFLGVLIYRKSDGSIGHRVYWKPTHVDLYLHTSNLHHPAKIILCALYTVSSVSYLWYKKVFLANGYSSWQFCQVTRWTLMRWQRKSSGSEESDVVMLSFCGSSVSSKMGRLVHKFDFRPVFKPLNKLQQWLWPSKDLLGLQTPGINRIPFVGKFI